MRRDAHCHLHGIGHAGYSKNIQIAYRPFVFGKIGFASRFQSVPFCDQIRYRFRLNFLLAFRKIVTSRNTATYVRPEMAKIKMRQFASDGHEASRRR